MNAVVGGVITNFATDLISKFNKRWSIKDKTERLNDLMILMHSVLHAAEGRVIHNPPLRRWLNKLKQAAEHGYEALRLVNCMVYWETKARMESSVFSSAAHSAKKFIMFWAEEREVDSALKKLEGACRSVEVFLKLLELECKEATSADFSDSNQSFNTLPSYWKGFEWARLYEFFDLKEAESEGLKRNREAIHELKSWWGLLCYHSYNSDTRRIIEEERWLSLQQICMANPLLYFISSHSVLFDVPPKILKSRIEGSNDDPFALEQSFKNKNDDTFAVKRKRAEIFYFFPGDDGRTTKMKGQEESIRGISAFKASLGCPSSFNGESNWGSSLLSVNHMVEEGEFS